jgi:hypothetical protein
VLKFKRKFRHQKDNCVRRVDWIPKNGYCWRGLYIPCSFLWDLPTRSAGVILALCKHSIWLFSDWKNVSPHHNTDKPEDQVVKTSFCSPLTGKLMWCLNILFGFFSDSVVLAYLSICEGHKSNGSHTFFFNRFRTVAKSAYYLRHVCLSICSNYQRSSQSTDYREIWCGAFYELSKRSEFG